MNRTAPRISVNQVWIIIFVVWSAFLTGGLAGFVGSPGILQAVRLKSLLKAKNEKVIQSRIELAKIQLEIIDLETNPAAQVREIRKTLGYAAPDELIFDFTSPDQF